MPIQTKPAPKQMPNAPETKPGKTGFTTPGTISTEPPMNNGSLQINSNPVAGPVPVNNPDLGIVPPIPAVPATKNPF